MNKLRIADFAEVITGGTPSTAVREYWDNGDIPWLQSGACQNCVIEECDTFITQSGLDNSSAKLMKPDSVLIALTGATTGKVGYLTFPACANQSVTGIQPNNRFIPKYLYYYLLGIRQKILHDSYGGAQKHISQGYVKNIEVPLVDIEKQKKIAIALDKANSIITNRQLQLNALDTLIKARFVEMFGNGKYAVVKASDVCEYITKGTTPSEGEIYEEYEDDLIPFLKVYNLSFTGELLFTQMPQYISKNTHNGKLARSKVIPNDVLMNIVGPPLGKFSLVTDEFPEWNINQAIAIFRAKERVLPRFLVAALMQPDVLRPFLEQAVGIRQLNLSLEQCRNLEFPLPPLEEQVAFVKFAAQIDKSKVVVQEALNKAQLLFDSLMQQYFG